MLQSFFKLTALRCSSGTRRDALGGKASGEGIQRCSDLIQVDDFASFQWSHGKAALAAFRQQALVLEKLKGVADWLSRNTKPFSQFLLSDPATGKQTAVRYGFHKPVINLIDENRLCRYGFHGGHISLQFKNSEFTYHGANG